MGADIVMDTGSQKSYIQLMNPVRGDQLPQIPEHTDTIPHSHSYSRCSVIRSAGVSSECDEHLSQMDHNRFAENQVSFYPHQHFHLTNQLQDKPVDFSPKNKFTANVGSSSSSDSGNSASGNGFEMVLNYTMVA